MADKVKEVAVGEADRIKSLTVQAARSAAYLYPIKASLLDSISRFLRLLGVFVLMDWNT